MYAFMRTQRKITVQYRFHYYNDILVVALSRHVCLPYGSVTGVASQAC